MKCSICETELPQPDASGYQREHIVERCRNILAERLSEVNAARRGAEAKADEWMARTKALTEQLTTERARSAALTADRDRCARGMGNCMQYVADRTHENEPPLDGDDTAALSPTEKKT
jgi:hypothetical protein